MGHGDHECCACCDGQGKYNEYPVGKGWLCSKCIVALARRGVYCESVPVLIAWIGNTKIYDVIPILRAAGYKKCFYENGIDARLDARGVEFDDDGHIVDYNMLHYVD